MKGNPLPEELRRSFDEIILVVNKMQEEAVGLLEKFGSSSKLYKDKVAQIDAIRKLYKLSSAYIERMLELNIGLGATAIAMDIQIAQKNYGMTYGQATRLLGYKVSAAHVKTVEAVDELIERLYAPSTDWPKDAIQAIQDTTNDLLNG